MSTDAPPRLTLSFSTTGGPSYLLRLKSALAGERSAELVPPYDDATWRAILPALEPGFDLERAGDDVQEALAAVGDLDRLHETVGVALAEALLAGEGLRGGFDRALAAAEARRQPLPVELRFGQGCNALAALPWELLHHRGRFLVSDTSIALTRYPEGAIPPTEARGDLPLRVLLVLSEPVDGVARRSRGAPGRRGGRKSPKARGKATQHGPSPSRPHPCEGSGRRVPVTANPASDNRRVTLASGNLRKDPPGTRAGPQRAVVTRAGAARHAPPPQASVRNGSVQAGQGGFRCRERR
jgi:hypothetical protein